MDRRTAVAALGAAALGSQAEAWARPGGALKGSGSPSPRFSVGRLKQSVSRWPYRQIPLPEFTRAAAAMGLAAVGWLGPEDWEPGREAGLRGSLRYATVRGGCIAPVFNDRANARR